MTDHTAEPILQFFKYDHLPERLQKVSAPFGVLALETVAALPRTPERSVALRKLLEAKDAAVRALLFVSLVLFVLMPSLAFAQTAAPAASPFAGLLEQFLTPSGIASIVGTLAALVFGVWKLSDLRKKQVATGAYYAFHMVEDIAATTENTVDDKVAAGLKALDAYMLAQGWRPLKPGEQEVAKLTFSAMHGAQKVAGELAKPPSPPTP